MDKVLLSVIVPAYNAEKFVVDVIESFLKQNADWAELIIVDDGSKDGTGEKCRPYISDRVRYFKTDNCGAGHARNYGIDQANGDWIGFVDSDDLIAPESLGKLYKVMSNPNNTSDIVYCAIASSNMDLSAPLNIHKPEKIRDVKHHISQLSFCASVYRKSFLNDKNIRFFEYREQDVETAFRFRAFSNTSSIDVQEEIALVIVRDNPTSNVHTWDERTLCRIKGLVYLQLYSEYNAANAETAVYLYRIYFECFSQLIKRCVKFGIPADKEDSFKANIVELAKGMKCRKILWGGSVKTRLIGRILSTFSVKFVTDLFVGIFKRSK